MLNYSTSEENYIKAIYHLQGEGTVNTNQLAGELKTRPASVTDMMKKLRAKKLVHYEAYKGFKLTAEGKKLALLIIRRHRLWEFFLAEKLRFSWDEVHEVAEQLEHIQSEKLIEKLDKFLDYPQYDPHGDEIPSKNGKFKIEVKKTLADCKPGSVCEVVSVKDNDTDFLQYVGSLGIGINSKVEVINKLNFDGTLSLQIDENKVSVSQKIAENIYIR